MIVSSQVAWPSHYVVGTNKLELIENYWDQHASIVLGAKDEIKLRSRFEDGKGPLSELVQDKEGKLLKQAAELFQQEYDRRRPAAASGGGQAASASSGQTASETAVDLAAAVEQNSKKRAREQAKSALAKRAPKRKARAAAPVI